MPRMSMEKRSGNEWIRDDGLRKLKKKIPSFFLGDHRYRYFLLLPVAVAISILFVDQQRVIPDLLACAKRCC